VAGVDLLVLALGRQFSLSKREEKNVNKKPLSSLGS
jgi:hypothetical protein